MCLYDGFFKSFKRYTVFYAICFLVSLCFVIFLQRAQNLFNSSLIDASFFLFLRDV